MMALNSQSSDSQSEQDEMILLFDRFIAAITTFLGNRLTDKMQADVESLLLGDLLELIIELEGLDGTPLTRIDGVRLIEFHKQKFQKVMPG